MTNRIDRFGRKEYVDEELPPGDYGTLPYQECQTSCIICHSLLPFRLIVDVRKNPGGIDAVVRYLEGNGVGYMCNQCHDKLGIVAGPLDKVKDV